MTLRPASLGVLCGAWLAATVGCGAAGGPQAGSPVADPTADCLPDMTFTDAHGRPMSLASLRGDPVLFDFIYTSCPGPCEVLTVRMASVADHLVGVLGRGAHLVSVTVDPEHDGPRELLAFAKARGADRDGWLFLTGPPERVDELMARFGLVRQRAPDGSIAHVLEFFLVGPDRHPVRQYLPPRDDPARIARDVRNLASGGRTG